MLGKIAQETLPLLNQLRSAKIDALNVELKTRIAAYHAQIDRVGPLFADVMAMERYLTILDAPPDRRNLAKCRRLPLPCPTLSWSVALCRGMSRVVLCNLTRRQY